MNSDGYEFDTEVCELSNHTIGGKALAFYLPSSVDFDIAIEGLVGAHENILKEFLTTVAIGRERADRGQGLDSTYFRFSGVIYMYCEGEIADSQIQELRQKALARGVQLIIRDREYEHLDDLWQHPVAFISHDSSDKEDIARPLSQELLLARCPVWYDEYSINIGDNIRLSIEDGIKKCRKCVIILSKYYMENNRWAKREFEAIVAREIVKGESVILPVWIDVTRDDVYEFSPSLANIQGIAWNANAHNIAWELKRVIELNRNN